MTYKKDLTKAALAALVLAAALPVDGQAEVAGTHETMLAMAKCGASCASAAPKNEIADNAMDSDSYNARANTYQVGSYGTSAARGSNGSSYGNNGGSYGTSTGVGTSGPGYSGTSGYGGSTDGSFGKTSGSYNTSDASRMNRDWNASRNTNETYNTTRTYNDSYGNFNNNRNPNAGGYSETYRTSAYDVDVDAYPRHGGQYRESVHYQSNPTMRQDYNTAGDYEYNRATVTTATAYGTLTEDQLLRLINPPERAIYMSLDTEGKALALQLASQESYQDKNIAVREAQRRINERRGMMNR